MIHLLATVTEDLCGTNGCDAGETVLGTVFILAIAAVVIALVR